MKKGIPEILAFEEDLFIANDVIIFDRSEYANFI